MIAETGEALRVDPNTGTAGGEAFTWVESYCETAGLERGWDPYEVWRTRVKLASVLGAVAEVTRQAAVSRSSDTTPT
jgi:hypothetical protein